MTLARRFAAAGALALSALAAGCAHKPQTLYQWESFPQQQYAFLVRDGLTPNNQIQELEAHAEKARGASAALPPGLRAHLGMLYLNSGNPDRARDLWRAEKEAFPESAPYLDQLLRRLDGQARTAPKESPL